MLDENISLIKEIKFIDGKIPKKEYHYIDEKGNKSIIINVNKVKKRKQIKKDNFERIKFQSQGIFSSDIKHLLKEKCENDYDGYCDREGVDEFMPPCIGYNLCKTFKKEI